MYTYIYEVKYLMPNFIKRPAIDLIFAMLLFGFYAAHKVVYVCIYYMYIYSSFASITRYLKKDTLIRH